MNFLQKGTFFFLCLVSSIVLASCAFNNEDTGSISFKITAPVRSAGNPQKLYYKVLVVHIPDRETTDEDWAFMDNKGWETNTEGSSNDVYVIGTAEGSLTEGVATKISISNLPITERASVVMALGEFEEFLSGDNDLVLYYGGIGCSMMEDSDPTVISIKRGVNEYPLTLYMEDECWISFYLDFSVCTNKPDYTEEDNKHPGYKRANFKYNLELKIADTDTTVYKIEGGHESISNYPNDDLHAKDDEITKNLLTLEELAKESSIVKIGKTKLTGTITLYKQISSNDNTTSSDGYVTEPTYTGTISSAVIWRAGLRCKVKMKEPE